jgi:O-antigen/teichoic acid export membrane protein
MIVARRARLPSLLTSIFRTRTHGLRFETHMGHLGTVETVSTNKSSARTRWDKAIQSAFLWDSVSYFASKVVPGFMGLISVPVFIRLIGLDQYGRFAVIVPLLMAIASAGSGWIAQGILRFHPLTEDGVKRHAIFARAVKIGSGMSVLFTAAALAALLAGLRYSLDTILISLVYCSSLLAYTIALSRLQANLKALSVLRREVVRSIAAFAIPAAIVTISGAKRFELVILGQAIAYTIALLPEIRSWGSASSETSLFPQDKFSISSPAVETVRQIWRFGWAVGLWLLLSQLFPVVDRWVIHRFAGYRNAGIYGSLYEVAIRSFSFFVFPLTQAAHPRIMRSWNTGKFATSYKIIRYSLLSQLIVFAAVFAFVYPFKNQITHLILGFDDPTAAQLLPALIVGGFLWQLALLLHKPMEIAHRTQAMLAAMVTVLVANVAGCFLLIPRFGYSVAGYILMFSAGLYIAQMLCLTRFSIFRSLSRESNAY